MKRLRILPLALAALLPVRPALAEAPEPRTAPPAGDGPVYVLPIRDAITPALLYMMRRGLAEAEQAQAQCVIIPMDTPGGRVDSVEEINQLLARVTVPVYTLVEHNAISGGALISIGTDRIYMQPGSKIGNAMPVRLGGDLAPAEREKAETYVAAAARATAQRKGHNPDVAEAMVRQSFELKIDDEVISPAGQVLTLTSEEAVRTFGDPPTPLLAAGIVDSLDDLLETLGIAGAEILRFEVSGAERVAQWLTLAAPLLISLGFLFIYIEFNTPGFGFPGIMGALFIVLVLLGHHIAGLTGKMDLAIILVGVALLLIEVFVIPGFGVTGFAGLALMGIGLIMSMVYRFPGDPWIPTLPELRLPLLKLTGSALLTVIMASVVGRFLPRSPVARRLVLYDAIGGHLGPDAADPSAPASLVGERGLASTRLTPSGTAEIGGRRLSVVSNGEFVDAGSPVVVVQHQGARVVVEPAPEEASA